MKLYKLSEMKLGWIVGNFFPAAAKWNGGEIAIKKMRAGYTIRSYYHENAIVCIVLLQGQVITEAGKIQAGQILYCQPGENIFLQAEEESLLCYFIFGDTAYSRNKINLKYLELALKQFNKPSIKNWKYGFENISVVIQGAVDEEYTPACIDSVRKYLPGSQIILSTWEGTDVSELHVDKLVLSKDPGGVKSSVHRLTDAQVTNNVNRQIVSFEAGLLLADKKYTLKIRSDAILFSNTFLEYFDEYALHTDDYFIVNHKILCGDIYSRRYIETIVYDDVYYIPFLFHPSDWFFFGYTDDLKKLYTNLPLMDKTEMGDYQGWKNSQIREWSRFGLNARYVPEQYMTVAAMRKNGLSVSFLDWTDITSENAEISEKFLLNNYIFLDYTRTGIFLPKYENVIVNNCGNHYEINGLYTANDYIKLYKQKILGKYGQDVHSEFSFLNYLLTNGDECPNNIWATMFSVAWERERGHDSDPLLDENKIKSADVSIVVQGYVDNTECGIVLDSFRKHFPEAQIILSTWKECDCIGLNYDVLVQSDDPGAVINTQKDVDAKRLNNCNRQIVSTQAGIQKATRKYILKVRSDALCLSNSILSYAGQLIKADEYNIFKEKVVVSDLFTRKFFQYNSENGIMTIDTPFHVSDWFFFGKKEDIETIFVELPLLSEAELGNYSYKNSKKIEELKYPFSWRFPPEQYIMSQLVRRVLRNETFDDLSDYDERAMEQSEQFIRKNFITLDFEHSSIFSINQREVIIDNYLKRAIEPGLLSCGD